MPTEIFTKNEVQPAWKKPESSSSCTIGAIAKRVAMWVTFSNPFTWDLIGSVLRRWRTCGTYAVSTPCGKVNEKITEIQMASGSSCFLLRPAMTEFPVTSGENAGATVPRPAMTEFPVTSDKLPGATAVSSERILLIASLTTRASRSCSLTVS